MINYRNGVGIMWKYCQTTDVLLLECYLYKRIRCEFFGSNTHNRDETTQIAMSISLNLGFEHFRNRNMKGRNLALPCGSNGGWRMGRRRGGAARGNERPRVARGNMLLGRSGTKGHAWSVYSWPNVLLKWIGQRQGTFGPAQSQHGTRLMGRSPAQAWSRASPAGISIFFFFNVFSNLWLFGP
jgi:hypothetical protein